MSAHSDLVYVQHILRALGRIEEYTRGMAEDVFMENSLVQDAVIRQFEVIGEAAKKVSPEFRERRPAIPHSSRPTRRFGRSCYLDTNHYRSTR